MARAQSTDTVLMIRPVRFGANPQTAPSNAFQRAVADTASIQAAAVAEFDALCAVLRAAGITIHIAEDTADPHTPDSIFPNNWISTHEDGRVFLYPMEAPNRRLERRAEIIDLLKAKGMQVNQVTDLSSAEDEGRFLEGTGSLVLDRVGRVAYACRSSRTDSSLLQEWAADTGYEPITFDAVDGAGRAIYHTNVMMCVGTDYAVICAEAISAPEQRSLVLERLRGAGHEPILITLDQMNRFAGNMLELRSADGAALVAMSQRAEASLDALQRSRLERSVRIVSSPIDTIEDCAGGSVRCMLAEIFLPRNL